MGNTPDKVRVYASNSERTAVVPLLVCRSWSLSALKLTLVRALMPDVLGSVLPASLLISVVHKNQEFPVTDPAVLSPDDVLVLRTVGPIRADEIDPTIPMTDALLSLCEERLLTPVRRLRAPTAARMVLPSINIVLVGHSNAGKSCFVQTYLYNTFVPSTHATLAVDVRTVAVAVGCTRIKVMLSDTPGLALQKPSVHQLVDNADGVLAVYDTTDLKSFQALETMLRTVQSPKCAGAGGGDGRPLLIVGTKTDLAHQRQVPSEAAAGLAAELGAAQFSVSCCAGVSVTEVMNHLIGLVTADAVCL